MSMKLQKIFLLFGSFAFQVFKTLSMFLLFLSFHAEAASNQFLVYQGRIVRPDGAAMSSGVISFTLSVYSPAPGNCLLYSETQSVNMAGSSGMFSLALGAGARADGLAHSFTKVFVNAGTLSGLTCTNGDTSYTPTASDDRNLVASFNDAGTVVNLSAMAIKSIPFALQAQEISGYGINDLVKVHSTTGSPTTFTTAEMAVAKTITGLACGANEILKWNGATWLCAADATGTSPGDASYSAKGIVQFSTDAATSGISIVAGVASVNAGTGASQIVKLDGAAKLPSVDGSALTNLNPANLSAAVPVGKGGTGLTTLGTANQVLGVNSAGTLAEYKTITAGTGITVSHAAGSVTINATAGSAITALTGEVTATGPGSVAATIANNAITTPKLFTNPGVNRLVATDASTGATLAPLACTAGQLLTWNVTTGWQCTNQSSLSSGTFSGSLSGDVTGTQSATVVSAVGGVTAANVASGANLANSATELNTASAIVKRDASGNFSAGTMTGNLTGNVTGNVTGASSLNVLKAGDAMTGNLTLGNATVATSLNNYNSSITNYTANYWNGTASASDIWSIQNILGTGANPSSTLQFDHTGSTGAVQYTFMNGNVGIGTTSPTQSLDVAAGALVVRGARSVPTSGNGLIIDFGGLGGADTGALQGWDYGATTSRNITLQPINGNVGIGVNPTANLHVVNNSTVGAASLKVESTNAIATEGPYLSLRHFGPSGRSYEIVSTGTGNGPGAGVLEFYDATAAATRMIIDSTGKVGIGTNPSGMLHVASDSGVAKFFADSYGLGTNPALVGRMARGTQLSPTAVQAGDDLLYIGARGYGATGFSSNSVVGIWYGAEENFTDASQPASIIFETSPSGSVAKQERVRINSAGYVGIGTAVPSAPLHVSTTAVTGNIATFVSTGAGGAGCSIAWNGASCSSDIRLKESVESADSSAMLNGLLKIRPVHFTWIKDPKHEKQTGFIAQEIEKIFPEFVKTDSNGYKQVNYAHFVSVLTSAVQEVYKKLQMYEDKMEIQSKEINILRAENRQIKVDAQQIKDRAEKIEKENAILKRDLELVKKKLGI
jgi:hypothetical protein